MTKFKAKDVAGIKAARYAKRMECGTTRQLKERHSKSLMLFEVVQYFSIYGCSIPMCRVGLRIAARSSADLKLDLAGYMYIFRSAAHKCIKDWLLGQGALDESYATYAISCCLYDNDTIQDWTTTVRTTQAIAGAYYGAEGVADIIAEPTTYTPVEVLNLGYSLRHKRAMRAGISIKKIKPISSYFMKGLDIEDSKHDSS